jgi:two-component system, LytTR family, sensor kinase
MTCSCPGYRLCNVQIAPVKRDGGHPGTAKPFFLASGRELSKSTLFYLLHIAGWGAFGAVMVAGDIAAKGPLAGVIENLSWIISAAVITLGFRIAYGHVRSTRGSYVTYGLTSLLFSILGSPLLYLATEALTRLCYLALRHFPNLWRLVATAAREDARVPWWIPFDYWVFYAAMLLMWSSLYFGINAMLDLEIERANVARALKLADTARLRALQSNINPHFLFNALNGIATLIREKDDTAASAMVDALGEFLRSTLQRLNTPEIQVAEELQLIRQYLQIQRFRFGERLQASVDADPDTLDALIPTLILQPLVENAVRHGVLPREDGGSLWVSIRRDVQMLILSVADDGPGLPENPANPVGVGLANSRDRLSALYGSAAQLTVGSRTEGGGFAVTIRMPFRRGQDGRVPEPSEALPA